MDGVEDRIARIRRFNRFYTRHVGALNEGLLDSAHSLTEVRIMYELRYGERATAAAIAATLSIDPAYLSRILKKLKSAGLVTSAPSDADRRERVLRLTGAGLAEFAKLDQAAQDEVRTIVEPLSEAEQQRLLAAMTEIRRLLGDAPDTPAPFLIRSHRPGDIGWIVHRHGALYAQEYGWDETFEGLVAEIAGQFLKKHDPRREHCWVAEKHGAIAGSVFLVHASDEVGKLRLLYVEPSARGQGLGRALVDQCIRFARDAGYKSVTLWTNDVLVSARRIYEAAGFELVDEEPHHSFGHDLVGQNWKLAL